MLFTNRHSEAEAFSAPLVIKDVNMAGLAGAWVTYEVWRDGRYVYLGICRLSALPSLPDAVKAGAVDADSAISLRILAIGDKLGCMNHRARHLRSGNVPAIKRLAVTGARHIRCETDGRVYRTQTEAAEAYGISQGNLSNHLRGRPGYHAVAGRRFVYVDK